MTFVSILHLKGPQIIRESGITGKKKTEQKVTTQKEFCKGFIELIRQQNAFRDLLVIVTLL